MMTIVPDKAANQHLPTPSWDYSPLAVVMPHDVAFLLPSPAGHSITHCLRMDDRQRVRPAAATAQHIMRSLFRFSKACSKPCQDLFRLALDVSDASTAVMKSSEAAEQISARDKLLQQQDIVHHFEHIKLGP